MIAISIALTSQLDRLQDLVADIRAERELDDCRILVGGNGIMRLPPDDRDVGADGCAESATQALRVAEGWLAA